MTKQERETLIKFCRENSDSRKVDFKNMDDEVLQMFADCLSAVNNAKRNAKNVKTISEALIKKLLK